MYKNYIIKPITDKVFEGIGFEGSPAKIKKHEYFSELVLEELKQKNIYLLLKPLRFYYEIYTLSLPVFNSEIVRLRLSERINNLGYFTRPFHVYWKVLEKKENLYTLAYLALENEEIERPSALIRELAQSKIYAITFLPFALAPHIPPEDKASLILHREREGLWISVIKKGVPYYVEVYPVDEFLDINYSDLKNRLNFVKTLIFRDYREELEKIYATDENLIRELEKEGFSITKIQEDYPEFWGILKVDSAFNFVPEEEKVLREVMAFNSRASFFILFLGILLFFATAGLKKINSSMQREIQHKENLVQDSLNKLMTEYPQEKLKAFMVYIEEKERLEKGPRPEDILVKIIQASNNARITALTLKKEGNFTAFSLSGEKMASAEEITNFSQELLTKLALFANISENKFEYKREENKISFSLKGSLK